MLFKQCALLSTKESSKLNLQTDFLSSVVTKRKKNDPRQYYLTADIDINNSDNKVFIGLIQFMILISLGGVIGCD